MENLAYGRVYIPNLRKKVTDLFEELKSAGKLNENEFIGCFKNKYPKDYASLVYEWEYKTHEFKKNRKGQPKHIPLRPDTILKNMYRNYYYKLVKAPLIKEKKEQTVNYIRMKVGQLGLKIKPSENGTYNVIQKSTKEVIHENITFKELKELYKTEKVKKRKRGMQNNDKS